MSVSWTACFSEKRNKSVVITVEFTFALVSIDSYSCHPSPRVLKFELRGYSPHLPKSSQWEIDAVSYDRISNLGNEVALGDSVIVQNKLTLLTQCSASLDRSSNTSKFIHYFCRWMKGRDTG